MPAEVIWLEDANDDLQSIFDFIASENPYAAERYSDALVNASERLATFPRSGRIYANRYRVLVMRNHVLFYRYDETASVVTIVAILDSRRNIATVLEDRKLI